MHKHHQENRSIKTALCISGRLGRWEECFESINENILKEFEPDTYINIWQDEDKANILKLRQKYKPASVLVNNYNTLVSELGLKKCIKQPKPSVFPMVAGFKALMQDLIKKRNYKKKHYDLVIRIRPDIKILEKIKTEDIHNTLIDGSIMTPLFEAKTFYDHEKEIEAIKNSISFSFNSERLPLPNQINDQITIGSYKSMVNYFSCYKYIKESIEFLWNNDYPEYMLDVPESILTICFKIMGLNCKQLKGSGLMGNISTKLIK